ncbi:uncharacterized protein RB166_013592 [Leptodactylus fuscus]
MGGTRKEEIPGCFDETAGTPEPEEGRPGAFFPMEGRLERRNGRNPDSTSKVNFTLHDRNQLKKQHQQGMSGCCQVILTMMCLVLGVASTVYNPGLVSIKYVRFTEEQQAEAMAESHPRSHSKPQEFTNPRGKTGIFIPGVFSSIGELDEMFIDPMNTMRSSESMRCCIAKCKPHDFQHMQVSFPVVRLQHVTVRSALYGIIKAEGFISSRHEYETRPGFRDLSFWSAQISNEDIEAGQQQANDNISRVVAPEDAQRYQYEFQKQFANSPAFNLSASRYGQYKFSFPLSDLLTWYRDEFCQGGDPQLRILGTEVYKQEIAHYILVHSPHTDLYNDLPMVPSVQSEEDSLGFVYWMNNTLYWRPQSTSDHLYVKILQDGSVRKECYNPDCPYVEINRCLHMENGIYSPWNHLGIAFHIPPEHCLTVSTKDLLENLTPCEKDSVSLGKEYDLDPSEVIKEIKEKFAGQKDKES